MRSEHIIKQVVILSFLIICTGCSRHTITCPLVLRPVNFTKPVSIMVCPFTDARAEEERTGETGEVLTFSSADKHFAGEVAEMFTACVSEELRARGLDVEDGETADYMLEGELRHLRVVEAQSAASYMPYVCVVWNLWDTDSVVISVEARVRLINKSNEKVLFDEVVSASDQLKESVGFLQIKRQVRSFKKHRFELIDMAVKNVVEQISDRVIAELDAQGYVNN